MNKIRQNANFANASQCKFFKFNSLCKLEFRRGNSEYYRHIK